MRVMPILVLALLAGCASPETSTTSEAMEHEHPDAPHHMADLQITVEATGTNPVNPAFSPATFSAMTGQNVTLTFTNSDTLPTGRHDLVIDNVTATDVIGQGESMTVTFVAPAPGTYTFYCSVPGHRANGMEGTFTVTA